MHRSTIFLIALLLAGCDARDTAGTAGRGSSNVAELTVPDRVAGGQSRLGAIEIDGQRYDVPEGGERLRLTPGRHRLLIIAHDARYPHGVVDVDLAADKRYRLDAVPDGKGQLTWRAVLR